MASTAKQKEVKTRWPVTSGIEANQKHHGRQKNLVPEQGSLTPRRLKEGMD